MSPTTHRTRQTLGSLTAALLAIPTLAVTASSAAAADYPTHTARPAAAFTQSVCINTHSRYADRAYGDTDKWVPALKASGIKCIRDGLEDTNQAAAASVLRDLAKSGIKTLYVSPTSSNVGNVSTTVKVVRDQLGPDVVEAVEGANEQDLRGGNWATEGRAHQGALYKAIHGDPALKGVLVVAPSLVRQDAPAAMGEVPADVASSHNYSGGIPESKQHLNVAMKLAATTADAERPSGALRMWSTEVGFHTVEQQGATAGVQPGVPEAVQGTYYPRMYLDAFNRGVERSYGYELLDETPDERSPESNFGIIDDDGTPKPAYNAIKTMLTLLHDTGSKPRTAGSLAYDVDGGDAATRTELLQKADGTFWLAVWQDRSVWDRDNLKAIPDQPRQVTITLGEEAARTAVYALNKGTKPTATGKDTRTVKVTSSADAQLVSIDTDGTAATTPPPTADPTPTSSPTPTPTPTRTKGGDVPHAPTTSRTKPLNVDQLTTTTDGDKVRFHADLEVIGANLNAREVAFAVRDADDPLDTGDLDPTHTGVTRWKAGDTHNLDATTDDLPDGDYTVHLAWLGPNGWVHLPDTAYFTVGTDGEATSDDLAPDDVADVIGKRADGTVGDYPTPDVVGEPTSRASVGSFTRVRDDN